MVWIRDMTMGFGNTVKRLLFFWIILLLISQSAWAWWDLSWQYRRPISLDNTVSSTLSNYDVLIILDTASLVSSGKMRADCGDLRFVGPDDMTVLSYWIEEGTCNTPDTRVWVRVPSIPRSSSEVIYAYYGNPTATSQSSISHFSVVFRDDFSDSGFSSYINRILTCRSVCTKYDSMRSISNSGSAYLDTGSSGFCGDAGLVKELSLPSSVPLVVQFKAKMWGAYWSRLKGVTIEKDGYGYGPKPCYEDGGGNDNNMYWLACTRRSNIVCRFRDPETGELYSPPKISGTWQSFISPITRYAGQTIRLRILVTDYSGTWCNMGDHPQKLWVDDLTILAGTGRPDAQPRVSILGEEVFKDSCTLAFFDDFSRDPSSSGKWLVYRAKSDPASEVSWDSTNKRVYLTRAASSRGGAIFANYDLTSHKWRARFRYLAGGGSGADGFAFHFYADKDSYVPGTGGSLGFDSSSGGYAIEFDNYYNSGCDPSERHIALVPGSNQCNELAYVNTGVTEDNKWHNVLVEYDEGRVTVTVDGTKMLDYTIPNPDYSFTGIGFSASTGGSTNNHVIDDFYLEAPSNACCSNGVLDYGEISVDCGPGCSFYESTETTCNDNKDNDCDGLVDCKDIDCGVDADGDGYYASGKCATQPDCDDTNYFVNPGIEERKETRFVLGGQTFYVPVFVGSQTPQEFYAYAQASTQNPNLYASDTLTIGLYQEASNPDSAYFVFTMDKPNDGSGGKMKITMTPTSASVVVKDDPGDSYNPGAGVYGWGWGSCCTDGMVLGPLSPGTGSKWRVVSSSGISKARVFGMNENGGYYYTPSVSFSLVKGSSGSAWAYRVPVTIDNTGNTNTLTDYQVLVTLDTATLISNGKMRSDCGDLRVRDSDGSTDLPYWIEDGTCNTAKTRIWVKVPSIPALSTKTIYVYYGNPGASSESDKFSVFTAKTFTETFDTFDNTKWSLSGDAAYDPSAKNVMLSRGWDRRGYLTWVGSEPSFFGTYEIKFDFISEGDYQNFWAWTFLKPGYAIYLPLIHECGKPPPYGWTCPPVRIIRIYNGASKQLYASGCTDDCPCDKRLCGWQTATLKVLDSHTIDLDISNKPFLHATVDVGYNIYEDFGTGIKFAGTSPWNYKTRIDNLVIKYLSRKQASPEPTTSVGSEEFLSTAVNLVGPILACQDGIDNDCDGKIDDKDPGCVDLSRLDDYSCEGSMVLGDLDGDGDIDDDDMMIMNALVAAGVPEGREPCCADLDGDGVVDSADAFMLQEYLEGKRDCFPGGYSCEISELCSDSKDNDCDSKTDLDDPDCVSPLKGYECNGGCQRRGDTNNDGVVDFDDVRALGRAIVDGTITDQNYCCGDLNRDYKVDKEDIALLEEYDLGERECFPAGYYCSQNEDCSNGLDDDCDGLVDESDTLDCAGACLSSAGCDPAEYCAAPPTCDGTGRCRPDVDVGQECAPSKVLVGNETGSMCTTNLCVMTSPSRGYCKSSCKLLDGTPCYAYSTTTGYTLGVCAYNNQGSASLSSSWSCTPDSVCESTKSPNYRIAIVSDACNPGDACDIDASDQSVDLNWMVSSTLDCSYQCEISGVETVADCDNDGTTECNGSVGDKLVFNSAEFSGPSCPDTIYLSVGYKDPTGKCDVVYDTTCTLDPSTGSYSCNSVPITEIPYGCGGKTATVYRAWLYSSSSRTSGSRVSSTTLNLDGEISFDVYGITSSVVCGDGVVGPGEECDPPGPYSSFCYDEGYCDYTQRTYYKANQPRGDCTATCQCYYHGYTRDDTLYCRKCDHCTDGIKNCGEVDVDKGGACGQWCDIVVDPDFVRKVLRHYSLFPQSRVLTLKELGLVLEWYTSPGSCDPVLARDIVEKAQKARFFDIL